LGTDFLGRDVLSRFLHGGRLVLLVGCSATILAYAVAVPTGIVAGLRRGRAIDSVVVAVSDVVYALPPLIFLLVLLAATGPGLPIVVLGIAITHIPRVLRIARLATIDLATREFVEASFARGEGLVAVGVRDIAPNILTPMLADFGVRLAVSIIMYSSLSYLGLGPAPPAADWGLMISENRVGMTFAPWVVAAPALAIAAFAVSVNILADSFARTIGRSQAQARTER
jgi:peptide/nickel transport system permease protein